MYKYLISILHDYCRFTVLFATPAAVVLPQCMGVGGCGWPRSLSVSLMIFASFAFKNIALNSDSAADAATNSRILQNVRIGPFRWMGCLLSGSRLRRNSQLHDSWRLLLKVMMHRSASLISCRMDRILLLHSYFSLSNLTCGSCFLLFYLSREPVRLRVYSVQLGGCCLPSVHNIRCFRLIFGRG